MVGIQRGLFFFLIYLFIYLFIRFMLYTHKFLVWLVAVPGQSEKSNIWLYSWLQMNKTTAPS